MKWVWLLPTCCFIRNTCSSSAFISLSCTSCTEKKENILVSLSILDETRRTTCHSLPARTFLIGGFVMTSSNGSSGLTVVKFSCKIAIFFSLSHPDGLEGRKKKRHFYFNCNASRRASTTTTTVSAPLTWTLRPSPPLRLTWWTESRTSCVRCICKADPGSSPLSLRYRWGQRHL